MKKFGGWFGGKTAPPSSRETRCSKWKRRMRPSLNEDIVDLSDLDFEEMENVHASEYPCNDILRAMGIHDSFYELVSNAGLLEFTTEEVPQYKKLTFIFVKTFKFFDGVNPREQDATVPVPCFLLFFVSEILERKYPQIGRASCRERVLRLV